MSTFDLISTIIESVAVIGVIIALFNDEKIANWEKRVFKKSK